jgi:predicted RNase H-like HicB family nuclease
MAKSAQFLDWHLRILIYPETEEGETIYCAHCLDFDLVEGGKTPEEAVENLEDVIRDHLEYANQKNLLDHLYNPAPPEFWNRFYKTHIQPKILDDYGTIAPEIAYSKLLKKNATTKTI